MSGLGPELLGRSAARANCLGNNRQNRNRKRTRRGLRGRLLPFRPARVRGGVLPGDENFAQDMKVTPQHAQLQITRESLLRPIAATGHAVTRLQAVDRRFNPRMSLASAAKLDRGLGLLRGGLPDARLGQARVRNEQVQLALVLRRMKTPIERSPLNAAVQTPLQVPRLLDHHVAIVGIARHQIGLRDEARPVLVDQHLASKLHRLAGFAAQGQRVTIDANSGFRLTFSLPRLS